MSRGSTKKMNINIYNRFRDTRYFFGSFLESLKLLPPKQVAGRAVFAFYKAKKTEAEKTNCAQLKKQKLS